MTLRPLVLACLFVTAAAVPALDYALGPGEETLQARRDIHRAILDQSARAPDRYRWLAAAIVEGPVRLAATAMPYDDAYDRVSTVFYVAAFTAMLWSLFAYLRVWFADEAALVGALLVACTVRITIRQHDYAPYSYLEATLFALGLLAIMRRRHVLFGVIVAAATLNRETGIFLVMLYAVTAPWSKATLRLVAIYGVVWAAIFGGVRIAGGEAERYWSVLRVLQTNLAQPGLAAFNLALFLGVFWLFAALGWRSAPAFVRRTALVLPLYLFTVAVWGIWWEVRLLMPMYPIIVPLALAFLFPVRGAGSSDPALQDPAGPEGPAPRTRSGIILASILLTAVAISAFDYSVLVPQQEVRIAAHRAIVDSSAPPDVQRRLLVPWLLEPFIGGLARVMPPDRALTRTYAAFHLLGLAGVLAVTYRYAAIWFPPAQAFVAALLAGSTLRLLLEQGQFWDLSPIPPSGVFAPHSILDAVFVGLGLVWLYERRYGRVMALTIVAALNSEASIVLPLAAAADIRRSGWRPAATIAVLWLAVTIALAAAFGFATPALTLTDNLGHLPHAIVNNALFLGPSVLLVAVGWRHAPDYARRSLAASSAFVAAFLVFGLWREVRVLMPMYPLVAPVLLAGIWAPLAAQSENSLASSTHSPSGASRS